MEWSELNDLQQEYKCWLRTLGFAESSVKSLPQYIAELLAYLKAEKKTAVSLLKGEDIEAFFIQWTKRRNKTSGAGLSTNHINKGALAINNFIKFLNAVKGTSIRLKLKREKPEVKLPEVLSQEEIKQLYEATHHLIKRRNRKAYGQRDRAMLAVYYGCGLRKSEGTSLQVSDVLIDRKLLLVRKGKGNKERLVPLSGKILEDIEEYLQEGREWFLSPRQKKEKIEKTDFFFIGISGKAMTDFTARLRLLTEQAGITKHPTLHTLRHSIATHFLQEGMDMDQIRKFLGHSSLESTQLYTHLVHEL